LVALGRAAVGREARPEAELVAQLRLVAAEEERLEEDGRLSVLGSLLVRQSEVARMPAGLARDRLDDVRVDLRQRVVARDAAERVGQRRVDAAVVQGMTRLMQER